MVRFSQVCVYGERERAIALHECQELCEGDRRIIRVISLVKRIVMVTKLETKQKNGTKYYGGQWLPISVLCATILKNIVFYIQQKK